MCMMQRSMDDAQKVLHSPFDFDTHNKTFTCYCEAIILPNGKIKYAVPSHQEKLISEYMSLKHITREDCEKEWMKDFNWLDKIMKRLKIVFVWYDKLQYNFPLTDAQIKSIGDLQRNKCIVLRR